ncbi:MAG: Exopolysaccharide production protein ExoZ [Parcubacteria bacterium C7867-003]|nr:MAG: Exopolysaccharide production protein ExoZ [Parcubacteria bacterium C7867-003]
MDFSHTSVLYYFLVMPILLVFSWFFLSKLPFYKKVIGEEEKGRFESLDGLRGLLAINVFFQHAVTSWFYFQTNVWEIVNIRFYRHLGGEAVILFLIMTSFLYWSKMIAQKGQVDEGYLYRSRFLRLAPMYIFCAGLIVLSILIQSGFDIDIKQTAKDILSWLTLGLITTQSVNGISVLPVNAGIHWTLHFEWFFYLLLPILAIFLRSKKMLVMALPLAFYALSSDDRGYWAIFFFGIMAAHIYEKYPKFDFFRKKISSLIPLFGIVLVYFMNYKPYSFSQYAVSLGVFLCFVYGSDLFGLLKTHTAKFLGTLSYSIYLIHGIVLFGVLHLVDYWKPIVSMTAIQFWSLITLSGLLTIIVSSVTYRYIEYPFIKMIKSNKAETAKAEITERVM